MILVTGATGNIGRAVVEGLQAKQIACRIGARHPSTMPSRPHTEVVSLDFLDPSTFAAAVRGCSALFLLRPPAVSNTRTTLNVLVDAARTAGVQQILFVSVAGAADNPLVPHHAVEQQLRIAEDWTILRPGFFAQNLGDAYREDIVQQDRIYLPAGEGRAAFVDTRDIAEVAVNCLIDPAVHRTRVYMLTGAQALSFTEVAAILSEQLERTITYRPATVPGYCYHLLRRRLPLAQTLVQTVLHVGLRFGQAETVDDTLPHLLGHPCRSLRDYVQDYRHLWLKPSA